MSHLLKQENRRSGKRYNWITPEDKQWLKQWGIKPSTDWVKRVNDAWANRNVLGDDLPTRTT